MSELVGEGRAMLPSYRAARDEQFWWVGKGKLYEGWGHRMAPHQLPPAFPYPGGKRNAATLVWNAFGDVGGYIEPFCGTAAVLLGRPPFTGNRVETVNDADGLLVNALRAIRHDPLQVAREAFISISEVDYHARLAWCVDWGKSYGVPWLEGDPEAYDLRAGAWWLYMMACAVGSAPTDAGAWVVESGRLVKGSQKGAGIRRAIPHVGGSARGILRAQPTWFGETHEGRAATYCQMLASRLSRVRITAGDWTRPLAPSVLKSRTGAPGVAVFLDPPYKGTERVYADGGDVGLSDAARKWCMQADPALKIAIAGYDNEHDELLEIGYSVQKSIGGQGSGYSSNAANGRRERIWFSPSCNVDSAQGDSMFDVIGEEDNE